MSIKYWIAATRPKTLPAGAVPVLIGSAFAFEDGNFEWSYFSIIIFCSIAIQILVNYINEIFDYKKGADNHERLGPQRAVAAGLISVKSMTIASSILMLITFSMGMILVAKAGWVILAIGLLSLLFSYAYTGGPYPLAYNGLGDIFVLVFFGIAAVNGTYYVFAEHFSLDVFIASLAPGFISMNLLGINNIRDIEGDKKVGKMTLSVKLGRDNSIKLHSFLIGLTYLVPIALYLIMQSFWILLPLLSIPYSDYIQRKLKKTYGTELNKLLANTGKLLILYGLLLTIGVLLS